MKNLFSGIQKPKEFITSGFTPKDMLKKIL